MTVLRLLLLLILFSPFAQAAPPPGHPSTDRAAELMGLPSEPALTLQGRVRQAIDSNAYTYLEVEAGDGTRQWLAAPRLEVAPEAVIRFGEGMVMQNFYSKKLQRTFARIRFVSTAEVIRPAH